MNHDDADFATFQILLVTEICIDRDENVELAFCKSQEFSVFFSSPARFLQGQTIVPKL